MLASLEGETSHGFHWPPCRWPRIGTQRLLGPSKGDPPWVHLAEITLLAQLARLGLFGKNAHITCSKEKQALLLMPQTQPMPYLCPTYALPMPYLCLTYSLPMPYLPFQEVVGHR